jgi:ubiquinone biosynthesis protein UbiJ
LIAASLFARGLNYLLQQSPNAAELLRHHTGQHVRFDLIVLPLDFRITDTGSLTEAVSAIPDVIVRITPNLFSQLPFLGRGAIRHADYSGDPELLNTLNQVFSNLNWDMEAQLALVFGDIVAHRIGTVARSAMHSLRQAAQSLQYNASEYVVEEIELVARKVDVTRFNREVDGLADDVARFEARLAGMEINPASAIAPPRLP